MTRRLLPATAVVLLVAALFAAAAWVGLALTIELGRVAAIWFSNAILVSALLLSPKTRWPWLIATTFVVNAIVNDIVIDGAAASVGFALANTLESVIAASLMHRWLRGTTDLLRPQVLVRFFAYAVGLAPAVAGALAAGVLAAMRDVAFTNAWLRWWAADALGMGIVVPLVLAIRPRELLETIRSRRAYETFGPFALLTLVAVVVFSQSTFPILFLLFPPLLLIAFRVGFPGTAIGISLCAALAFSFTMAGFGPLMLLDASHAIDRVMLLQLLLATLILTTYPVCAVLSLQKNLLHDVASSEERFRALAANSHDIIALTDMDGIWRYMSPAVTTVFGWKPEDLVGKDGMSFVHIEDAPLYMQGTELLMQGREVIGGSFRMRHREGRYIWVETISRRLTDAGGKQLGWVSNSRDISARKRVEQLKNEFISTVNHELRTPLTAMLGAIGLAASGKFGPVDGTLRRLLAMAKTNGERLSSLVDDILDFEKVSSGKMQFDLQSHAIEPLLDQALAAIRPYAAQHQVTVLRGDTLGDHCIRVDAGRFQQVMANLLSNAAKFSHSGGKVVLSASVHDGRCRISIIDRGCGIPAEFRSTLFERFAQADQSDGRRRGGTGLGMAIAKHFTEQMRGTITFESKENVGTTFHVDFPLVQHAGYQRSSNSAPGAPMLGRSIERDQPSEQNGAEPCAERDTCTHFRDHTDIA
jgi:PAS domain S-box-containing protein